MRPDGGPLAPVRVTPEDFHYVAENFVQFLQTLAQVGQQLSGQVNAAAGIAGIDEYAKDFDAQFRPVADEVFAGFDRACNLLGDISTGIDWSGVNHWRADHASVPGNNPDETPWTPASSGTYLPMNLTAPSLFGHTKFPIGVASLEQKIPLGSPSGLHALADDFGAARDQVQDLTDACHNQLETLFANNSSADLDALDEYWDRVGGASDTAILTALVRGCDQLCQSLHDYAEWMTEAMDQVIRTLADLALQAGFSFVFGLASLFSGEEEGVPVAISKLGDAIGVAKIAAAVDTAVVAVAGTALVSLGFGIDAINGAMTAAINATP
ncbi:MAG TPA: hypothetical protein VG317_12680, partial [Pseudonocardiaceae bacterium]|nr:hypothetical protein [Pseudonocardiaceae bacterium]